MISSYFAWNKVCDWSILTCFNKHSKLTFWMDAECWWRKFHSNINFGPQMTHSKKFSFFHLLIPNNCSSFSENTVLWQLFSICFCLFQSHIYSDLQSDLGWHYLLTLSSCCTIKFGYLFLSTLQAFCKSSFIIHFIWTSFICLTNNLLFKNLCWTG